MRAVSSSWSAWTEQLTAEVQAKQLRARVAHAQHRDGSQADLDPMQKVQRHSQIVQNCCPYRIAVSEQGDVASLMCRAQLFHEPDKACLRLYHHFALGRAGAAAEGIPLLPARIGCE
jgi:hypothetical protein